MLIYLQKKHNFLKMDLIGKGTFGKVFAIDQDVVKKYKTIQKSVAKNAKYFFECGKLLTN